MTVLDAVAAPRNADVQGASTTRALPSKLDWVLRAESVLAFLYSWLYFPISQGHRGDFFAMLTHRDNHLSDWDGQGYAYGPIFVLYELMLRPFHDVAAMRLMFALNLVILAATFVLLVRTFFPGKATARELSLALFVWVNFYPLVQLLRQNNVEITELFFLTAATYALMRSRDVSAGVLFGMAISTKIIPICLVPYLAWRRKWKAVFAAVAAFAAMMILVAAIKGFNPIDGMSVWRRASSSDWAGAWNNNQAFTGFFLRFFGTVSFTDIVAMSHPDVPHPQLGLRLAMLAGLALAATVAVCFIRRSGLFPKQTQPEILPIEMNVVLAVVLLSAPLAHTHYFGLIVSAYFAALWAISRRTILSDNATWWFLLSYLFLGFLLPLRIFDPIARRFIPGSFLELWKLANLPILGVLLAVLALLSLHRAVLRTATAASRP